MSSAVNTASKDVVNLLSRSRIRNRNRSARSPRSMSRLRACWVTQAPVGWAVIPGRCTWRRRARSQRGYRGGAGTQCRRGRNPRRGSRGPARTGTAARSAETVGRMESRALQDLPDGRGGHDMAESDQLTLDPSVAPSGILAGHPQHQGPDRRCGGRSARSSAGVGPAAGDELGVPAQQRSGRHQPHLPQRGGEQSAQRAEHGAVEPGEWRSGVGAA